MSAPRISRGARDQVLDFALPCPEDLFTSPSSAGFTPDTSAWNLLLGTVTDRGRLDFAIVDPLLAVFELSLSVSVSVPNLAGGCVPLMGQAFGLLSG